MRIIYILILIVHYCGNNNLTDSGQIFELKAMNYVIDSLIMDSQVRHKFDKDDLADVTLNSLYNLNSASKIYYSNSICKLTSPYEEVTALPILDENQYWNFDRNFKSKIKVFSPSPLNHSRYTSCTWENYQKLAEKKSFFVNVREKLETHKLVLVEINVTCFEYIDNPYEFTFYVLFNRYNEAILDWDMIQKFELLDGKLCE